MNTLRFAPLHPFLGLTAAALLACSAGAQLTEWPTTVKPGRFLIEMDAISLTLDREEDFKYTAFGAASVFLTTGVTQNLDVQVGAEFLITQRIETSGFTDRSTGVGDVYVRTKWRFFEAKDSYNAAAIIPWVKIPTNSGGVGNDAVEGGIILPWEARFPGGVNLYAMAELDFLRNDADDGYDTDWFGSMALSRQLIGGIGAYAEIAGGKSSGGGSFEGTMGGGVTWAVREYAWWDFAVYRGITRGAADWNPVVRFNVEF